MDPFASTIFKHRPDVQKAGVDPNQWWESYGANELRNSLAKSGRQDVLNAERSGQINLKDWYSRYGTSEYANPFTGTTWSKYYANQAGANKVNNAPVFEEVLPFQKAWESVLPTVREEAATQINPGVQRQLAQQNTQFYKQLAGSGGGRFGSAWGQLGSNYANSENSRRTQMQDWENLQQQGFKSLWYDPTQASYNRSLDQGKMPGTVKPPTWAEFTSGQTSGAPTTNTMGTGFKPQQGNPGGLNTMGNAWDSALKAQGPLNNTWGTF